MSSLPLSPTLQRKPIFKCGISLKRFRYYTRDLSFPCGDRVTSDATASRGEEFMKICGVQTHAWEMEGSLSVREMRQLVPVQRYDHVAKSNLRKNFAKDAKRVRLS